MSKTVTITLDGTLVEVEEGQTIWQAAKGQGTTIPHLCWRDAPAYRADGNCRSCMVEVEGERVLAASCARRVADGMVVRTDTDRARKSREMVFEMLGADMGAPDASADGEAPFWTWARDMGIEDRVTGDRLPSKFGPHDTPEHDATNPAIAVNLDACIACNLCVRACREVQVNDVMGMAGRGHHTIPVFDQHDPMGHSTCVTCGECVQACPTGALMEKTLLDTAARTRTVPDEKIEEVDSVCPFCGVGCQTKVAVADGRIVRVDGRDGPANENRLCVKGRFGYDYAMSERRLTVPLVRRDGADKPLALHDDPMSQFREATWEEAMERAAGGLTGVRDRDGGQAIAGFGSAKGSNEEAYLFQKLIRAGFGTNNVDHCTRLCHASSVSALLEGVGSGAVSAPFMDAHKADCVIVIGARPTVNHPVAATYFKRAAKRGTKLVVCDPRGQDLMTHATHSLQFKPGTDVALLNAMLHVIVEERLYDEQYIQANVAEFDALKAKVADFPPEAMADTVGIDARTIREVARLYATSQRSMIFWGMGISQHVHGTDNSRCLIALALITGHIGRPGTGLHPLRGQNNVQGASDAGLIPMSYPDYKRVDDSDVRARLEDVWGRPLDMNAGLTVVEVVHAIHDGDVKGMYIMGENPAMSDPDQTHARAALGKLEHLVVQDIFFTETCQFADVILPASSHAEKRGTYTNTNRQVQMGRPAMALPGEARQDLDILIDLGARCGLDWSYDGPAAVYAEMASVMPSLDGITWDMIEDRDSVTYPLKGEAEEWVIFTDGFPTEDGRGKLVPADLLPPDEVPDADFPMVLTTGRLLEHWHTGAMTRTASVLDRLEPEGIAAMHPRQIERMGLTPGQAVTIETRRGGITATLRADREVADNMVFIPFCFVESAANMLTNPQLDPYGKIPEFKFCAARVFGTVAEAAE